MIESKRWRGRQWSGGEPEKMERARETEGEGEAKNKPWSASQSRSHRGEEALRGCVYVCVCLKGKTVGMGGLHSKERRVGDSGLV